MSSRSSLALELPFNTELFFSPVKKTKKSYYYKHKKYNKEPCGKLTYKMKSAKCSLENIANTLNLFL